MSLALGTSLAIQFRATAPSGTPDIPDPPDDKQEREHELQWGAETFINWGSSTIIDYRNI